MLATLAGSSNVGLSDSLDSQRAAVQMRRKSTFIVDHLNNNNNNNNNSNSNGASVSSSLSSSNGNNNPAAAPTCHKHASVSGPIGGGGSGDISTSNANTNGTIAHLAALTTSRNHPQSRSFVDCTQIRLPNGRNEYASNSYYSKQLNSAVDSARLLDDIITNAVNGNASVHSSKAQHQQHQQQLQFQQPRHSLTATSTTIVMPRGGGGSGGNASMAMLLMQNGGVNGSAPSFASPSTNNLLTAGASSFNLAANSSGPPALLLSASQQQLSMLSNGSAVSFAHLPPNLTIVNRSREERALMPDKLMLDRYTIFLLYHNQTILIINNNKYCSKGAIWRDVR